MAPLGLGGFKPNRPIVQQLRFPSIDVYLAAPWTGFPEFSPHGSLMGDSSPLKIGLLPPRKEMKI